MKCIDINEVLEKIKGELDPPPKDRRRRIHRQRRLDPPPEDAKKIKVSILYAFNSSGKTRLSKSFHDQYKGQVLFYNAFTEDLFNWDNDNYVLKFDGTARIFQIIDQQGMKPKVIDNFKKFTGSKLEPDFDFNEDQITFRIQDDSGNIKISRGEESVFIWSVFYTVLEAAIAGPSKDRDTTDFDDIQYVVIDDPVSSMDDTRIITIALALAELIAKSKNSKNQLKFLITTHHALFFNILFKVQEEKWDKKHYTLSKSTEGYYLDTQREDSPFAYHHMIISEIEKAIEDKDIKKYHFNLFRALLEKTANFLGHKSWRNLLSGKDHGAAFIKALNHYSHDRVSDVEPKDLSEENKEIFKEEFDLFIEKFNLDGDKK